LFVVLVLVFLVFLVVLVSPSPTLGFFKVYPPWRPFWKYRAEGGA